MMEHSEAIQQMTAERYLLDELSLDERESFEQHVFDCPECAMDLRAGSVFITEAKTQLPELSVRPAVLPTASATQAAKKRGWSFWFPVFAVPAFAAMLGLIAYQDLSVIPALKRAAGEPRILHSTAIHLGTRGAAHTSVRSDRTEGLALSIELPQSSAYSSYLFELYDVSGKQVWNRTMAESDASVGSDDGIVSLMIPGPGLTEGSYTLSVSGVTPQSSRVEIDHRVLDVLFNR
jgi:anti-sigma factor RsiW